VAVVAVLMLGLLSLAGNDTGDEDLATGAQTTTALRTESAEAAGETGAADAAAGADAEEAVADLGAVDDDEQLRAVLATDAGAASATTAAGDEQAAQDDDSSEALAAPADACGAAVFEAVPGSVLSTARLVWQGTPAEVRVVSPISGDGPRAVVTDQDSCRVLATVEL
jgi:hypothetical protein